MNVAVKPGQMPGAPKEHGLPRPVTEAQRRRGPGFTATRTGGGSFGLGLRCSLLTDPLRDMLVVRASAQTKISLRIHARISATKHYDIDEPAFKLCVNRAREIGHEEYLDS